MKSWQRSRSYLIIQLCLLAVCLSGVSTSRGLAQTMDEPEPTQQPEEKLRVDVNLVTLRFTVRAQDGRFLNTVPREAFRVLENGNPREIEFFQQPVSGGSNTEALWLAFLLDVSGSTFATRGEEILAARAFFENVYTFTRVGIFGFTDSLIPFLDFTADKQAALEAMGTARAHLGRTALYDSVETLLGLMRQHASQADRKIIIVVSDGMDPKYEKVERAVNVARENRAVIYTIWVPSAAQLYIGTAAETVGHSQRDSERANMEQAFARLSAETGGRHFGGFETILDFDEVLAEINDEVFGNLYGLGYYTEQPYLSRAERNIQVLLDREGASVHGLFKNVPEMVQAKKQYLTALFDADAISELPSVSGRRFREIGAELDFLRPRRERDGVSQPFRIKINAYSLQGDTKEGVRSQLGIVGLLLDQNGNEVARLREIFRARVEPKQLQEGRGIIYTNRLLAPPGEYQLRLALLEIATWKLTAFESRVRITEPD